MIEILLVLFMLSALGALGYVVWCVRRDPDGYRREVETLAERRNREVRERLNQPVQNRAQRRAKR